MNKLYFSFILIYYIKQWPKCIENELWERMGKTICIAISQSYVFQGKEIFEFSHYEFNGWDCAIKDILISQIRNAEDLKSKAALRDTEIVENIRIEGEALSECISLFIELSCSNQLYGEQMTFLSEFEKKYYKKNVCMNEEEIKQTLFCIWRIFIFSVI